MSLSEQELANLREQHNAALFFGFTLRAAKAQATKDGLAGFLDRLDQMIGETETLKLNAEQEMRKVKAEIRGLPDAAAPLLRAGAEW